MLTLVDELTKSGLGIPTAVLAERHGWPLRTIYRDLHALEEMGMPISQADGGRWTLVEGWRNAWAFPLPLDERLALQAVRQLATPLRGTALGRAFERLHDRLVGPASPFSARRRQGELFRRLRPLWTSRSLLAIDYARHEATIETLCRAMESGSTLRATYFAQSRGELTTRNIDPYHLHWDPGLEALYLFAFCRLRREVRTFAVHRFRALAPTAGRFVVPADFSTEAYLGNAFRIWREKVPVRVRIAIDEPEAGWVCERRWHGSQEVVRRADGGCELSFVVDGTRELKRFILQFGAAIEVLEPASLRRDVAREHAAAAKRGSRPVQGSLTLDDKRVREDGRARGRRGARGAG